MNGRLSLATVWLLVYCKLNEIVHNDPSRSSDVIDFGTNRKRIWLPMRPKYSNLGPAAFQRAFCTPKTTFFSTRPLFGRKCRGVPLGVDPWCLGCKRANIPGYNWNWRLNYFRRIPTYVITIHRHRRTDGQTDDMRSQYRSLHYSASRGKNEEVAREK